MQKWKLTDSDGTESVISADTAKAAVLKLLDLNYEPRMSITENRGKTSVICIFPSKIRAIKAEKIND